jgi:hypothetical protein
MQVRLKTERVEIDTGAIDTALKDYLPQAGTLTRSINMRVNDDVMSLVLPKGAAVPASAKRHFNLRAGDVESIHVRVYAGDSDATREMLYESVQNLRPGLVGMSMTLSFEAVGPDALRLSIARPERTEFTDFDLKTGREISRKKSDFANLVRACGGF